jgi:very-short-patch-repair endonuclease
MRNYAWEYEKHELAQQMRANPTPPERIIWDRRAELGVRLARQVNVLGYIADFTAPSLRTVIEIDGKQHHQRRAYDRRRDRAMTQRNWRVIRLSAATVLRSPDLAVRILKDLLHEAALEGGWLLCSEARGFVYEYGDVGWLLEVWHFVHTDDLHPIDDCGDGCEP